MSEPTYPCRLYLISPPTWGRNFAAPLEEALAAGDVGAFQLRLKEASDAQIREATEQMLRVLGLVPVLRTHAFDLASDGQAFTDWLISAQGQKAIADFRVDGQQLFFPNAKKEGS